MEFPPETGPLTRANFEAKWDEYCVQRRRTWPTLACNREEDRRAMLAWSDLLARCAHPKSPLGSDWCRALRSAGESKRFFQPFAMPQRWPSTMTGVPADDQRYRRGTDRPPLGSPDHFAWEANMEQENA